MRLLRMDAIVWNAVPEFVEDESWLYNIEWTKVFNTNGLLPTRRLQLALARRNDPRIRSNVNRDVETSPESEMGFHPQQSD